MIARGTALATAGELAAGAIWLVSASRPQPAVRTYYFAADTVTRDCAPSGRTKGQDRPFSEFQRNYMEVRRESRVYAWAGSI